MSEYNWLPDIISYDDFNGNWDNFLESIYTIFHRDFVETKPIFRGTPLALKRYPMINNKEATFWHMISEGPTEQEKIPNIRRCERVPWAKPVVENCDCGVMKIWRNRRKNEDRIIIWFEEKEFLVVLADRKTYKIFWTCYNVTEEHRKRKLNKEYEDYVYANAAL